MAQAPGLAVPSDDHQSHGGEGRRRRRQPESGRRGGAARQPGENLRSRDAEWRPTEHQQPRRGGNRNWRNGQSRQSGRSTWVERRVSDTGQAAAPRSSPEETAAELVGSDHLPQLVQDLQLKLAKAEVECMICYDGVGRRTPIWSCSSCYSIFHITCVRKWARAPTSVDRSAGAGDDHINWRCPGCQAVQLTPAGSLRYTCFCGQQVEPPLDFYLTPHSCGGPCRKPLDKAKGSRCTHICTLQCHPGPCPPCLAFAAPESCGCGRTTVTRRCAEKDGTAISCGQPCGRMLQCGRHRCSRLCHDSGCGPCAEVLTVRCFCQRKREHLPCGTDVHSAASGGAFCCGSTCSKPLSCGKHRCSQKCHPGSCGECGLSPSQLASCPCGKLSLRESAEKRKACTDPVPTCGDVCQKLLPCNEHRCGARCHLGPCPPCVALVKQTCRCGGSSRLAPCSEAAAAAFVCDRKCGKKKSCGRHRCNNVCCLAGSEADDSHLCLLECGKKLRCGQHACQELCHPGHCPPCLQSSFTELCCACGRSSIPPPVPCGTPRPQCDNTCSFEQACGHPATHTCHFGDCPPCKVPVAKECVGKHMTLRNVPCGSSDIRCNLQCGKTRRCGRHSCQRSCHSGDCDAGQSAGSLSCGQACGAPRRDCAHTCVAPCHPGSMCPDTRCNFTVEITCSCKRLSAKVPCDAGGGLRDPSFESRIIGALPTALQPVEDAGNERVPFGRRKLACDDECTKSERLKALADALGIGAEREVHADGVPETVQEMLRRDPSFVNEVEERFKYLVSGSKTVGGVRVQVFCSMPKDKREVIHQLAQKWFLSVNSVGWDPRRFMVVHVTQKSKAPPARFTRPSIAAPKFNPTVDLDPRLVIGLFNLSGDADISSLVLRFGGECELIWLNDRNAVAIFSEPARAATALRRVDGASPYHGAFVVPAAATSAAAATKSWSKSRVPSQDPEWVEDNWEVDVKKAAWHDPKATGIAVSNPWSALVEQQHKAGAGSSSRPPALEPLPVVDDWEQAL